MEIELNSMHRGERISVNELEVEQLVKETTRRVLKEYCNNTTIHGCKYLTAPKRHWTERFLWTIVFVVLIGLCGFSIFNTWSQWNNNPVKMSIGGEESLISEIPFPTVTVCSETKALKSFLTGTFNSCLLDREKLDDIQWTRCVAVQHLCSRLPNEFEDENANESIFKDIEDMAPSMLESDSWDHGWSGTGSLNIETMTDVLTEEGMCHSFNTLNSHEIYTNEMAPGMMIVTGITSISNWNPDNGYDESDFDSWKYPIRTYLAGHVNAL
ncbi:pickpocket protein 28-like [Bradysia coprophila]|uniref:pickpocket protein 28-like n=1 Tax=Bradysia coprophila TaxID=38358 RepID=UPI00187DAD56|nr:pickpocket protein 28-like [Bradysia coprophila]